MISLDMPDSIHGVVEDNKVIVRSKHNHKDDRHLYVTSWSACRDSQETQEEESGGVFITAFADVLREHRMLTHAELLIKISERINAIHGERILKDSEPQLGSLRKIKLICDMIFEM